MCGLVERKCLFEDALAVKNMQYYFQIFTTRGREFEWGVAAEMDAFVVRGHAQQDIKLRYRPIDNIKMVPLESPDLRDPPRKI